MKHLNRYFLIGASALFFAQGVVADCSQSQAELSASTLHTIAGLVCSQQVVSLMQKGPRQETGPVAASSGATFFHSWKVTMSDQDEKGNQFHQISGVCAKKVAYPSENSRPVLVHPGYALTLKFSSTETEKCNPTILGEIDEIRNYSKKSGLFSRLNAFVKRHYGVGPRTVAVSFSDLNQNRALKAVSIGEPLDEILKHLKSPTVIRNAGGKDAIGLNGMNFSNIELDLSLSRALYTENLPASVSGDSYYGLTPTSTSQNFYVRMENMIVNENDQSTSVAFNYQGGRNAFFYTGFEPGRVTKMAGCTDLTPSGGSMKTYDCQAKYERLSRLFEN